MAWCRGCPASITCRWRGGCAGCRAATPAGAPTRGWRTWDSKKPATARSTRICWGCRKGWKPGQASAPTPLPDEFAGGMKRGLNRARAPAPAPPVLLLDEPTSGLDPAGREAMLDLLGKLGREHQKSLILCTHLLGDVERVCTRVLIL